MNENDDDEDKKGLLDTREKALDAARRAVQFLESGQATGIFVLLTDDDHAVMWDSFITPRAHPIGDTANVLMEIGARMRSVWYNITSNNEDGRGFLAAIKDADKDFEHDE